MKTEEKSEKINRILGIISAVIGIVGSIFGIFQAQQAATLKNEVNSLQTALNRFPLLNPVTPV